MQPHKAILIATTLCLVAGCTYPYGKQNYKTLRMERLELGMTQEEVETALGRGPSAVIGSVKDNGHIIAVHHYVQAYFNWYGGPDHIQYEYYLYYLDGELVQWGRPGDWQAEADKIIEVRFR
ncbi:MAG: outer membrane protein assembly factor BamE [candidate division Zixibacteria bacterium]|nr:outer membrane protein assembly factor BamE [candidate division Zixibacteria bacterium]